MLGTKALQIFDDPPASCARWPAGWSSTTTSRAASAPRAARAFWWLVQILRPARGRARHGGDLDKLLDLSDNIARPVVLRSRPTAGSRPVTSSLQYFRDEYIDPLRRTAAAHSTRLPPPCSRRARERHMTVTANPPPSTTRSSRAPKLVTLTIDGFEVSVPEGHVAHPGRGAAGHPDPALLRPPAARPRRRMPAVPGRGRDAGNGVACPSRRPRAP